MARVNRSGWVALGALAAAAGLGAFILWSKARVDRERPAAAVSHERIPGEEPLLSRAALADSAAARNEVVVAEPAERTLEFELVRFPDEAPLDGIPVEIEPRSPGAPEDWPVTSGSGRVIVAIPSGARSLHIRASGYEPHEVQLQAERELHIALIPSSGLFGRVLRPDGAPAARADVRRVERLREVRPSDATRAAPSASVWEWNRVGASTTSDERGFYFLPGATRTSRSAVCVDATTTDGLSGALEVALPREPSLLDDILLHAGGELTLRVIDLDGRGVSGAFVGSSENPIPRERSLTDETGALRIAAPLLPASFTAEAEGLCLHELRLDGRVVPQGTRVESNRARVELVLAPKPIAKAHVVDAETGFPIFIAQGRVELFREAQPVGETNFELNSRGEAQLVLSPRSAEGTGAPDLARISVWKEGYREDQTFELDLRAPPPSEPIVLALEPEPDSACLRGRALRAGAPVPELQVGLNVQRASEGTKPTTWKYTRAYTDAEGRFSLRWKRDDPDQVVTMFPHWTRWDEYAFLGPMSVEEALAREQVLELHSATRVPALLRGVVREGDYRYYVSVVEGGLAVSTTINGAPIAVSADGEVRTTLLLPSQRRSRVKIGIVTGSRAFQDSSTSVEYDPAHPSTPLVFEVQPAFASVSGRVVGFALDELGSLGIGYIPAGEEQTRLTRPADDGSFELARVNRGEGELYLLRDGSARQAEVLGKLHVVVDRDLQGLLLGYEPQSLPERHGAR